MPYEVIVLGGSGTFPAPGAACSGYLFRSGTTNLWVDTGPGSFANLQRHIDPAEVNAILLTHLHLDHCTDFFPFTYWKRFGPGKAAPPMDVYAPAEAPALLGHLAGGDPTFDAVRSPRPAACARDGRARIRRGAAFDPFQAWQLL